MNKKMSQISFFSLHLETFRNGIKIGDGTGFIYELEEINHRFLVTNYHVVTNRDPKAPERLLPGAPDSPDEVRFSVLKDDYQLAGGGFSLLRENNPRWLEHQDRGKGVDIVAIPIQFPDDALITSQHDLDLVDDINFEIGSDLFIVGFPFGFSAGDFFPIWKKGTVASEPLFKPNGLPRFYIDSFTKPGMSGSPVFAAEIRSFVNVPRKVQESLEKLKTGEISGIDVIDQLNPNIYASQFYKRVFQFVGIYSGRIAEYDGRDPNIGIVWQKELIDELFTKPNVVDHPYPPERV